MRLEERYTEKHRLIVGMNDLETWCEEHPEEGAVIKMEWNNDNGSMSSYKAGSMKVVDWKCSICGKVYTKAIRYRLFSMHGECAKQRTIYNLRKAQVSKLNDKTRLSTRNPEAAKDWDYEMNKGDFNRPEHYSIRSTTRAHWKCSKCGTRYVRSIRGRALLGYECPGCKKNKK